MIISKFFIKSKDKNLDKISLYLLILGALFIVFSLISPAIIFSFFTPKVTPEGTKSIYDQTGPLGDTLGGVMNPFIAIAGVIITGLAFFAQYNANRAFLEANEELKKQFKLQQFESQFYEMLSLHKENVNEMAIEGYDYNEKIDLTAKSIYKDTKEAKNLKVTYNHKDNIKSKKEITGRKIFYLMLKELHATYEVVRNAVDECPNLKEETAELLDKRCLNLSYNIFFSGKEIFKMQIDNEELDYNFTCDDSDDNFYRKILTELEILRTCHKQGVRYLSEYNSNKSLHLDFSYKPFGGHIIRFAHFYRHMYAIVNFVVNENSQILTYEDKRRYLKMFRAQLSNHEIALLYYNWLAGHGDAWELKLKNRVDNTHSNKFFTDYRMIHNLSSHLVLKEFDPEELFKQDFYTDFLYKEGKKNSDGLFELYDLKSTLNEDENRQIILK